MPIPEKRGPENRVEITEHKMRDVKPERKPTTGVMLNAADQRENSLAKERRAEAVKAKAEKKSRKKCVPFDRLDVRQVLTDLGRMSIADVRKKHGCSEESIRKIRETA